MKTALITGANKGIGLAAARGLAQQGFRVFLGARDTARGEAAATSLQGEGFAVEWVQLDINDAASIEKAAQQVAQNTATLDVLVNNAGAFPDKGADIVSLSPTDLADTLRAGFETNVIGTALVTNAFWDLLQKSDDPRVINVSSGMGSLASMEASAPAYSISKTALNAVTRQFAACGKGKVSVNSICPGWVQTDMGGAGASRTPEQGASIIVKLATMNAPPTGHFLNEDGELPW
jgi:NAD(P)-dependent dehydrogenase (short-subunit alcohol dehydrogenase family)